MGCGPCYVGRISEHPPPFIPELCWALLGSLGKLYRTFGTADGRSSNSQTEASKRRSEQKRLCSPFGGEIDD